MLEGGCCVCLEAIDADVELHVEQNCEIVSEQEVVCGNCIDIYYLNFKVYGEAR